MICDPWLLIVTGLLVGFGLFMVGSASNYVAMEFGKDPSAYGWRHLLHLLLGLGALIGMLAVPYQRLAEPWVVRSLLAVSFATLIFVLTMPEICDARRWIPLGVFNFQPSEFAKLTTVVYLAWVLSHKQRQINDLWAVPLPSLMIVGAMAFLVVIEPDLGSAVVPLLVAGVMIVVAGLRWLYALALLGAGGLAFLVAVFVEPYRIARLFTFLEPWADPLGRGYQLCQSQIAFGNGGLTGMGMGGGGQRALFLPAPHTDFIYSVVGEDYGMVGCTLMLAAFLFLFWRGIRAALRAPDHFGSYLALGITCLLVLQALINMGVCLGLLPTKGLPLPFISYGGSSLVLSMAAMGVLLNVSTHSN